MIKINARCPTSTQACAPASNSPCFTCRVDTRNVFCTGNRGMTVQWTRPFRELGTVAHSKVCCSAATNSNSASPRPVARA